MARIYVGRSTGIGSFERHVVLKMILPERANDHIAVQMFLDEARLAASLNHQNVAQVFEVDEDAGIHFLAMEYVHGQDLRALLAKAGSTGTRVPLELALTVVTGAAAGLHHAHERRNSDGTPMGIVHRDVSPSNIMIGYDGAVKLLDFGIAKATSRSVETQSGIIKGKFAYMAPEQCRGRDVDRRSDVFSLGIILYEVTTQHRCFRADSDFDTMHRIVTGDIVRPTRLVQGYPPALEAIVMTALSVDAAQRYQSAGQLLEAIEGFASTTRMSLSTMSLGRFMREMFGEVPEPWLVSGRVNQPLQPREQTISNTSASGSGQRRAPSAQSSPYEAPMHLPPDPELDRPARRDSAPSDPQRGGYPMPAPMLPAFAPFAPSPGLQHAGRAPMGTQPLPPPQFGMHPGSGSGPSHSALGVGPHGYPVASAPAGHGAPGGSHSGLSYPRYEHGYDGDVDLQPNNRMMYLGLGGALVGIIVLLAIVIADGAPDELNPTPRPSSSAREATPGGSPPLEGPRSADTAPETAARAVAPEPVKPAARPEPARPAAAGAGPAGLAAPVFEQVTIHVESTPPGADVLLAGNVIGTTPLTITRARGTGVATLTIHRARYQDVHANIDLSSDYSKAVTLAPIVDDTAVKSSPPRDPRRGERGDASHRDRPERVDRVERDRPDRAERGDRAKPDRSERAAKCQPLGQINPFDTDCDGKPCPPCEADSAPN
jgi:serine/threonine protein kinase